MHLKGNGVMKKIVINLPEGFKYKINETKDTLEINIEPVAVRAVKKKAVKRFGVNVVVRDGATGEIIGRKVTGKQGKVKSHKRSGTGGTGPRKKK